MKKQTNFAILILCLWLSSCGIYNFTGTGKIDAETFQVAFFQNRAALVEPGIDRRFTLDLQQLFTNQTNLKRTTANPDLLFEGEIVEFRIAPMTATANQTAAENQLTVAINVRYTNKKHPEESFEKRFSHFYNYKADQLIGSELQKALDVIYGRITQDIFNESLAKW